MVMLAGYAGSICADSSISINIGTLFNQQSQQQESSPAAKESGPPSHAPAHGYRAKHQYHYYPANEIYFDSGRGIYFFLSSVTDSNTFCSILLVEKGETIILFVPESLKRTTDALSSFSAMIMTEVFLIKSKWT